MICIVQSNFCLVLFCFVVFFFFFFFIVVVVAIKLPLLDTQENLRTYLDKDLPT